MLPHLQEKSGPVVGTLILGAFFGACQLPQLFDADSAQAMMGGLRVYPLFILTEIGLSVMMTWVYNNTKQSSLIAGHFLSRIFHAGSGVVGFRWRVHDESL